MRILIYTSVSLPILNCKVLCIFSSLSLLSHLAEKCDAKKWFYDILQNEDLGNGNTRESIIRQYKFIVENSESAFLCENGNYVNLKENKMKCTVKFCDL